MTSPTVHTLAITLLDDAVFSRSNATAGGHDTLSRIPGSALLGAAAARLYASLGSERAFLAFHSGKLRFGDGWPLTADGTVALPAPLCLHRPKEGEWKHRNGMDTHIDRERVRNFLHASGFEDNAQPKQLRDGHLTLDGRWLEPAAWHRLKTAIDPEKGRASEGQLFGYSALQAGQRFAAEIHADADVPHDVLHAVLDALQGRVLLGRSRSAEYGAAQVSLHPGPSVQRDTAANETTLSLWLLTDLAPADAHGALPGTLSAGALGLPGGCGIDWSRSFARARSYSVWNSHRHGYAAERWVLEAGGVLAITPPAVYTAAQRAELCATLHAHGLGLGRETGLGQVWADAPLLAQARPQFQPAAKSALADTRPAAATYPSKGYSADLLQWLGGVQGGELIPYADIRNFLDRYRLVVESGRRAAGIPVEASDYAPSRSQWGTVYEHLRRSGATFSGLFDTKNGAIKATAKGWSLDIPETKGRVPLAIWLKKEWEEEPWSGNPIKLRHLVRHLKEEDFRAPQTSKEAQHG